MESQSHLGSRLPQVCRNLYSKPHLVLGLEADGKSRSSAWTSLTATSQCCTGAQRQRPSPA